jgi:hypothetical protein
MLHGIILQKGLPIGTFLSGFRNKGFVYLSSSSQFLQVLDIFSGARFIKLNKYVYCTELLEKEFSEFCFWHNSSSLKSNFIVIKHAGL